MAKNKTTKPALVGDNAKAVLSAHVKKIEELEARKKEVQKLINAALNAAKADGFDKIPLREVLRLRRLDNEVRVDRQQKVDEYKEQLGMNDMLSDGGSPSEDDADKEAA